MKLIFKQRFLSWFDSYDIYSEAGEVLYTVKGQLSWGHRFKIFDASGREVAEVSQKIFSFLPRFEMYMGDNYIGCITKEFSFFKPKFSIDCNGWQIDGDFFGWDYTITDESGREIATVSKVLLKWTDTYVIDVRNPLDSLGALMLVIAIDAEKCSNDD